MKECPVDGERVIIEHDQAPEIPQPADGALDDLGAAGTAAGPDHLASLASCDSRDATRSVRCLAGPAAPATDRFRSVVAAVGDHPLGFLPGSTRMMPPPYADRGQCFLRERDCGRGCRVKVVSQRNTHA